MKSKFTIKRFKKDGTPMSDVKIKEGIWVEPHTEKQEGFIYFPGTLVPHIHVMELQKNNPYGNLVGGPSPWTDPKDIKVNHKLIQTEDIYQKLLDAKEKGDTEQIEFLSNPLVEWFEPTINVPRKMYPMGMIISNRNDKSDFVYKNLPRFEVAIKKFEETYFSNRIIYPIGICCLINLLSSKLAFRVGNNEETKSAGVGITTFRPENIRVDDKGIMHFEFKGKRGVNWHKKFKPENNVEHCMYQDLIALKNKNNEFLFMVGGKRITSKEVNIVFRDIFNVKPEEESYLSFHSWRHYNASKAFLAELDKLNIEKEIKKIEDKNDINTNIKKARLVTKEINKIFKSVATVLNDTPGVVRTTYAGGKIFKEYFSKHNIDFDEKKRTWNKDSYESEIGAEKQRREEKKRIREEKKNNDNL